MNARLKMFRRLFSSKRAESDHPMWQTVIDIVLFAIVAMIFVLFGFMVLQDQRVHQIYYSKDLSLLQNAFYPAHEYLSMQYTGYKVKFKSRLNLGFGNFSYVFDEHYTSVNRRWKGNIAMANKDITVSYIHLFKPDILIPNKILTLNNPSAINFTNSNGATAISTNPIIFESQAKCDGDTSYLKRGFKTYVYPADLRVQYEQVLSTLSPNYISSLDSLEVDKRQDSSAAARDWSMIVFDVGQINRITIYYPFGKDNSLACSIYNILMKEEKLKDRDIRLIPSQSVIAFKEKYALAHNVFIEVNPQLEDIGYVMRALSTLSRQ
jgi:hypothetical protein